MIDCVFWRLPFIASFQFIYVLNGMPQNELPQNEVTIPTPNNQMQGKLTKPPLNPKAEVTGCRPPWRSPRSRALRCYLQSWAGLGWRAVYPGQHLLLHCKWMGFSSGHLFTMTNFLLYINLGSLTSVTGFFFTTILKNNSEFGVTGVTSSKSSPVKYTGPSQFSTNQRVTMRRLSWWTTSRARHGSGDCLGVKGIYRPHNGYPQIFHMCQGLKSLYMERSSDLQLDFNRESLQ